MALIALGVVAALAEALATLLVYALLMVLTGAQESVQMPIIGDPGAIWSGAKPDDLLIALAVLVGLIAIVRGVLQLAQYYFQNRLGQNFGVRLGERLLKGYLAMPYDLFLRRNSAEMMRNIYGSVQEAVGSGITSLVSAVSEALLILAILGALIMAEPGVVTIAALVSAPVIWGTMRWIQPRTGLLGKIRQQETMALFRALQQALEGFREVRILGRDWFFVLAYGRAQSQLARAQYQQATLTQVPRLLIEGVLILVVVAAIITAIGAGYAAESLLAAMGVFGYAILRVLPAGNRILQHANSARFSGSALETVVRELEVTDSYLNPPNHLTQTREPLTFNQRLALCDVSYTHLGGDRPAVDKVSLVVPKGTSLGVVGPTGGGKSTLLDLIIGLLRPETGRVSVDGADVADSIEEWQRNIAMVSQSVFMIDDTLRRNVALGHEDAEIDDRTIYGAIEVAQLKDVVERLPEGLETVVGERGARLSGGQRQRVAIARALYTGRPVLVLDEGTSALDGATEAALMKALAHSEPPRTLITVAHRLSTVRPCNQIVILVDGRIADVGKYEELWERSSEFRHLAGAG